MFPILLYLAGEKIPTKQTAAATATKNPFQTTNFAERPSPWQPKKPNSVGKGRARTDQHGDFHGARGYRSDCIEKSSEMTPPHTRSGSHLPSGWQQGPAFKESSGDTDFAPEKERWEKCSRGTHSVC